jgi:hypothetical protein
MKLNYYSTYNSALQQLLAILVLSRFEVLTLLGLLDPEDDRTAMLQNVGNYLPDSKE